jgi:hypothetical protein
LGVVTAANQIAKAFAVCSRYGGGRCQTKSVIFASISGDARCVPKKSRNILLRYGKGVLLQKTLSRLVLEKKNSSIEYGLEWDMAFNY